MGLRRGSGQARGAGYGAFEPARGHYGDGRGRNSATAGAVDVGSDGIAELEGYIAELRSEIARAEAQIAAKRGHRSAADSLFKF